ncbi:CapA family protein [Pseudoalteromonas sp. NEC-BIFX-2020_015]|uniref:CapA family protein n=1 Tax=Pseudoalteromonas sp. NEC-BIFX-2020_015 TaxID=2729544 RepID=UPI002011A637|nr:CapA family protein [Pseudoalteromonas sp. NEC-BIFX-2020_015]
MKLNISKYLVLLLTINIAGCKVEDPYDAGETQAQQTESQKRAEHLKQTFTGSMTVKNEQGQILSDITVSFASQNYQTDANGQFTYNEIAFGNHRLVVSDSGYFPLAATITVTKNGNNQDITLSSKSSNTVSLLFAGDTMFGRRFLDPSLATMTANIPDIEGALIRPATAAENAQYLTQFVGSFFQAADFTSVNLESPVTASPETPHPTKEFSFFSLPETLAGIKSIGVDYVALGNNHVYDFLDDGLNDTLTEVANAGIANSGAGNDIQSAYQPEYMDVGTVKLGLFSATSITGKEHAITYVTDETKGGAADLTESELVEMYLDEAANNSDYVIAQMHGGDEYSYEPSNYIKSRFNLLSKQKTNLIIAHHPHIAQGFSVFNGVPAILGLGNFVFDQDRLDTLLGVAVLVHVNKDSSPMTERAYAYPIYVEGYQPKFINGFLSDYLLRRLAEFSDDNITLIPRDGYADVYFAKNQASSSSYTQTVTIAANQSIIDLRDYAPSSKSFLTKIELISGAAPSNIRFGRDVMVFGDFEDWDNDDEQLEVARWDHTGDSVTPCISQARNGQQGLCSSRTQFDNTPSIIPFRQTIRAMELPNLENEMSVFKDFSLFGYSKADNAGKLDAKLVITTAEDGLEFSTQYISIQPAGSHTWQAFNYDFTLPSDDLTLGPEKLPARGIKVTFNHYPPEKDEANLALDDVTMISWQTKLELTEGVWQTNRMHGFDFINLNSNDPLTFKLTFSTLD